MTCLSALVSTGFIIKMVQIKLLLPHKVFEVDLRRLSQVAILTERLVKQFPYLQNLHKTV